MFQKLVTITKIKVSRTTRPTRNTGPGQLPENVPPRIPDRSGRHLVPQRHSEEMELFLFPITAAGRRKGSSNFYTYETLIVRINFPVHKIRPKRRAPTVTAHGWIKSRRRRKSAPPLSSGMLNGLCTRICIFLRCSARSGGASSSRRLREILLFGIPLIFRLSQYKWNKICSPNKWRACHFSSRVTFYICFHSWADLIFIRRLGFYLARSFEQKLNNSGTTVYRVIHLSCY